MLTLKIIAQFNIVMLLPYSSNINSFIALSSNLEDLDLEHFS